MPSQTSREVFARLVAHFPALGGPADDPNARIRARDWLTLIDRTPSATAQRTVELLVTGFSGVAPRIADWQETARTVAYQRAIDTQRPALESGERTVSREWVHALLEEARQKLDANRPPNRRKVHEYR